MTAFLSFRPSRSWRGQRHKRPLRPSNGGEDKLEQQTYGTWSVVVKVSTKPSQSSGTSSASDHDADASMAGKNKSCPQMNLSIPIGGASWPAAIEPFWSLA